MTTTQEILAKRASLKFWEKLEIKRRYAAGYEAAWFDISKYLISSNNGSIKKVLDYENFGYCLFKTGDLTLVLNNTSGDLDPGTNCRSIFVDTTSRNHAKVRYSAGYRDENSLIIDEVVFVGLINDKTVSMDYNTGEISITVLGYESTLSETYLPETSVIYLPNTRIDIVIADIVSEYCDTAIISVASLTFTNRLRVWDTSVYAGMSVFDVFTRLCQISNSIWYFNNDGELVFQPRTVSAGTAFAFIGGASQKKHVNILQDGIIEFDVGLGRVLNSIAITDYTDAINAFTSENVDIYGEQRLELALPEATLTTSTIYYGVTDIGNAILTEFKAPKIKMIVRTVFMPNVLNVLDPCTVELIPKISNKYDNMLILNAGMYINDDNILTVYQNNLKLSKSIIFKYYGYAHAVKRGYTDHYLIEM